MTRKVSHHDRTNTAIIRKDVAASLISIVLTQMITTLSMRDTQGAMTSPPTHHSRGAFVGDCDREAGERLFLALVQLEGFLIGGI